jgi:hypothetical protein
MEKDVKLTLDHLKEAMAELAKQKRITPERAVYEHLCEACAAFTVDDQGREIPDSVTRAMANRLMKEFGFVPGMPEGGKRK